MHRLILMRHAQAEASAPSGGDEARPLSAAGRAEALLTGRALVERGLKPVSYTHLTLPTQRIV